VVLVKPLEAHAAVVYSLSRLLDPNLSRLLCWTKFFLVLAIRLSFKKLMCVHKIGTVRCHCIFAALNEDVPIVKQLLLAGADPLAPDAVLDTVLLWAYAGDTNPALMDGWRNMSFSTLFFLK